MRKITIWITLFIAGIIMILGASEFSRWIGNDYNWYITGIILSVVSGFGILFDIYFNNKKG